MPCLFFLFALVLCVCFEALTSMLPPRFPCVRASLPPPPPSVSSFSPFHVQFLSASSAHSSASRRFPPHPTIILLSPAPLHLPPPIYRVLLGEGWTKPDGNRSDFFFVCHLCGWVMIFGI